jgi:hypothetical protein
VDQDPAFQANADPDLDPVLKMNADPDLSSIFKKDKLKINF